MRPPKDPQIRINEILNAAEYLFLSKGYKETTIHDIATRMGVAQGTMYYYFKSKDDVLKLIDKLCQHGRKLTLRSTFIVGFPGETEEEFQELCDFVQQTQFDDVGVFTYSREDGTAAALMEDQIPEDINIQFTENLLCVERLSKKKASSSRRWPVICWVKSAVID